MTGTELKAARLKAGMSQFALADKAGVSRDTVQYWEAKPRVDVKSWGPKRLIEVLKLRVYPHQYAPVRPWGVKGHDRMQDLLDRQVEAEMVKVQARMVEAMAKRRVICGAKTRKGAPCRMKSEPGRRRCKFHGGKSTGPKTPEGRERIAKAQRLRWANWRSRNF